MDRRLVAIGFIGGLLQFVAPTYPVAAEEAAAPAPAAAAAPAAAPAPPAEAPAVRFSNEQLDQMVAPVALYPDPLLIQVVVAATYPLEIVEADRWVRGNASLKGDVLDKALEQKDWDPSVEGLTHFPDLLKRMSDNLDWTKDLGDAFLDQKDDVLDAVQRMRRAAQAAGTLQTNKEQTITKETVNSKETIVIQPADPQVVYVPTYAPAAAYGPAYAAPSPYYPAMYPGYTGGQMATASLLSFGAGVAVGALIGGGCDWGSNDVHVTNNYYGGGGGGGGGGGNNNNSNNNVNVNVDKTKINAKGEKWQHNPEHRRNVGYRDPSTAKKFDGQNKAAARDSQTREAARGYDRGGSDGQPGTGQQRPGAGTQRPGAGAQKPGAGTQRPTTGTQRPDRPGGGGGAAGRPAGGGGQQAARPASPASGGKQAALGSYGNGGGTRQESQRGATSRGGKSWAGASPSPQGGGGGSRGGGGGGGGGHKGGGGGGGGSRGGGGGGGGGRRR